MAAALGLARRGLGLTAPNPSVGCLLVRDGVVVGRGWTQPGGRPHAETEALRRAGDRARGATAYVTLEPCAHHGRTPPCADALIAAGIVRCVVAITDPDPRVAGAGLHRLREAGIVVEAGLMAEEAGEATAGFLSRITRARPLVTLKLASTLDGRIATQAGESRWITGPESRASVHILRRQHDAVAVGIGTALADDPELTIRLSGLEAPSPVRIVFDGSLRLPPEGKLARLGSADGRTLVLSAKAPDPERAAVLRARGVEIVEVACGGDGHIDPIEALRVLGTRGLTRVLVEGGATLAAALLKARCVDRLIWFRSPHLIGGDGHPAVASLGVVLLAERIAAMRLDAYRLGDDLVESLIFPC